MRALSVPRNRVGVLKPKAVKEIEAACNVAIDIGKGGEVEISSKEDNGGDEWLAEQVVNALLEGFEPKHAFKLLKDEYYHEVIDLEPAFHRKEKQIQRAKARIIGEEGKAKKMLESLTGTAISIPDNSNSVAIIGRFEEIQDAKEAVLRLMEGAAHKGVYSFLQSKAKRPI